MSFETNNFNVAKKYWLEKNEFNVECNISSGENIKNILVSSIEASVENYELKNGELAFSGNIDLKIVLMNENDEINTICSVCPFSSKFVNENLEIGQNAVINVKVVDYNIDSVSSGNIKILVSLMQSGFVVCNKEIRKINCNSDDVCTKNEDMEIINYLLAKQETFEIESEVNVRDKIKKLILTESNVIVKNIEADTNCVVLTGEINSNILYINENDKFESGYISDSFKQEIEALGVAKDSIIEGRAFIKQEKIVTEIAEEEKGCKIIVKNPVSADICVYNTETMTIVKDLYSTKNEINVTTESFQMTKAINCETIERKIDGAIVLENDKPRIDKIMFFGGNNVMITNNYIQDGQLTLEGIAKTNVVYLNDDENSWNSVQLEIPFVINDKVNFDNEGELNIDAIVYDVDVSAKKGREIEYNAKVKVNINCYCEQTNAVISEVSQGERYQEKDCAMEVFFGKQGEELWNIAKNIKIKEEQILSQNPGVAFPLTDDSPLIIFYQKINEN